MTPDRAKATQWLLNSCLIITTIGVAVLAVESLYVRFIHDQAESTSRRISDWQRYATGGTRLGPEEAAVSIVVFSDYQCVYCAELHPVLKLVRDEFRDEVALVYRHFLGHSHSRDAAIAAECAGRQGSFMEFSDVLFAHIDSIGRRPWTSFALESGIDSIEAFESCRTDLAIGERVDRDYDLARALGVVGTPSLLINGELSVGSMPAPELRRRIERASGGTGES